MGRLLSLYLVHMVHWMVYMPYEKVFAGIRLFSLFFVFPPVFFLLSFFFGFLVWFVPQTIYRFFIPHSITAINRAIIVD